MSAKSSAISSCFGITSRFSLPKPIQGNHQNPFKILCFTRHSSNQQPLKPPFKDIKNLDQALTLFSHMLQLKPMPHISDYTKLFNIIIKMECYSEVVILFKKLIVLGVRVEDYMMNPLIDCYCRLREVRLGFAIVASFVKMGYSPDIVSFNCLIKGWFWEDNVMEAVSLFKKLIREEVYEITEVTVSTVLNGLVKCGHVAEAFGLLQLAEKRKWKLDVVSYTNVIDGLCKIEMIKDGREVLDRMKDRGIVPDVVSYTTLLDGLCKAGMMQDSMELIFRMIDSGISPNVVTYNVLIHGLCSMKRLDSARAIFNGLPSKGIRPSAITYNIMIHGLCRNRKFKDAKIMLEKMELDGCIPCGITYNSIIQACLRQMDCLDSQSLLQEIAERDFILSAPSFFLLLRKMREPHRMDIYDDAVTDNLIRKFVTSDAIYQIRDNDDLLSFSSSLQNLMSEGGRGDST